MRSMTKIIMLLLLLQLSPVFARGYWEQVRHADWEFPLEKVFFVNENRGWILGMHDELLFTSNGGENWTQFTFPDEIEQNIPGYLEDIFFVDESTGWIVGDEGIILKTSDQGMSWEFIETNILEDLDACWFVDELHGWVVGYNGTIFSTNDGGESWLQQMSEPDQWWFSDVCFVDSLTGWVVSRKGSIFYTDDGGATWHRQFNNEENWFISVFFIDENIGWASGKKDGVLVHTDNGGLSWQLVELPMNTSVINSLFFVDGDYGWATTGGDGKLLHTENGGSSWVIQKCPTLNRLESVSFIDKNRGWAVGDAGTIFFTEDGGNNWESQVKVTSDWPHAVYFSDSLNGWATGSCISLHTMDGGKSWDFINNMEGNDIFFIDDQTGWIVHAGEGIYYTNNGGKTWSIQDSSKGYYSIYFLNKNLGWAFGACSDSTYGLITTNGGESWSHLFTLNNYSLGTFCFIDSLHGWQTGSNGTVFRTLDGGYSWEFLVELCNPDPYGFCGMCDITFVDSLNGWMVGGIPAHIWHTDNGGENWIRQQACASGLLMSVFFFDQWEGWIVGDAGDILHTTDGGNHWDNSYSELNGYWWDDVFFTDRQHGWIVGMYGAVMRWVDDTSVREFNSAMVTDQIKLLQNHPNPFNPKTQINYQLPEAAHVKLEIYNLLGQRICTLLNEEKPAGSHSVRWDGRDDFGAAVSSGVYLYQLTAGRFCETRKMVVMR